MSSNSLATLKVFLQREDIVQERVLVHLNQPPHYTNLVKERGIACKSQQGVPGRIQFKDREGDLLRLRHQEDLDYFLGIRALANQH